MGESMITSFDGMKLYLKKETAADNELVVVGSGDLPAGDGAGVVVVDRNVFFERSTAQDDGFFLLVFEQLGCLFLVLLEYLSHIIQCLDSKLSSPLR